MTHKSMSFDDVDIDTIGGNAYKILLGLITKNEAVDRMKNVKLSKKMDNYDDKKNICHPDVK